MSPSSRCTDLVKKYEGFRSKPYLCPAGVPTIGYGHTDAVSLADSPISEPQAAAVLAKDLQLFAAGVLQLVHAPLSQGQFDALVSFAYNVGLGNFKRSTLLRKLNSGDFVGAAAEFGVWTKAAGKPLPGLVARRREERLLFES